MQLIQAPKPFSPAFGEILYTLLLTEEEEKEEEISIFNSSVTEKIGIKKTTEAPEFIINVSDYVRSQIQIKPFAIQESGIVEAPERIYRSCIACHIRGEKIRGRLVEVSGYNPYEGESVRCVFTTQF